MGNVVQGQPLSCDRDIPWVWGGDLVGVEKNLQVLLLVDGALIFLSDVGCEVSYCCC